MYTVYIVKDCVICIKKGSHLTPFSFVGAAGFEPATPWSQTRCANRTALRPEIFVGILVCDPPAKSGMR